MLSLPTRLSALLLLAGLSLAACAVDDGAPSNCEGKCDSADDDAPSKDPAAFLASVEGLSVREEGSEHRNYRRFIIEFEQPLDHAEDDGRTFRQRIILHHRDSSRPFVLYTSGYQLFSDDFLAELSVGLDANQISVEQRFFGTSITENAQSADWEHVRIAQAAADHHRIVLALKPFYTASWLSTGHSKGGMTSIFHRRFYPEDVDATVAYVTPISFALPDDRYHAFFDSVSNAACRENIRALQNRFLELRDDIQVELEDFAFDETNTFERFGGLDVAIEDGIVWFPWIFFQSNNVDDCSELPDAAIADDFDIVDYFFSSVSVQDDFSIEESIAYTFQAAAELGYPSVPSAHLSEQLLFSDVEVDRLPTNVTSPSYSANSMIDVETWVREHGNQILFVYGSADPWIAGAYNHGDSSSDDKLTLVANRANHHALLKDLSIANRQRALNAIERWVGVEPMLATDDSSRLVPPSLGKESRLSNRSYVK